MAAAQAISASSKGVRSEHDFNAMAPFGRADCFFIEQFPFLTFSYRKSGVALISRSPTPIVNER